METIWYSLTIVEITIYKWVSMILPDDKMPVMVGKDGKKKTVEVVMNPELQIK